MKMDDVTQVDQRLWDRLVEEGCGFARDNLRSWQSRTLTLRGLA